MKIIKPGIPPSQKPIRKTCTTCGCLFEYDVKHIKTAESDKRGGSHGDQYVTCPQEGCHANLWV